MKNFKEKDNTSIALGNFDGVHLGHIALIKSMIEDSKKFNIKSSILLFENHTKTTTQGHAPELLTDNIQRENIIRDAGVDILYKIDFDLYLRKLSAEEFVRNILIEKLNIKSVTVGYDYKFGYKAQANAKDLHAFGDKYGFKVNIVEPVMLKGEIISSTKIRQYLKQGKIQKANDMLGRNYTLRGKVVPGKNLGNKLGFPTANINLSDKYLIPKNGVYRTITEIEDEFYYSISSIGKNPTFDEKETKIETHILDFNKDIYGKDIEIQIIEYLRSEKKFNNLQELKNQIKYDIEIVKKGQ